MNSIFAYPAGCRDFSTTGLFGDIAPLCRSAEYTEEKNGECSIELRLLPHQTRSNAIPVGGYIKALVPVRTMPAISNDSYAKEIYAAQDAPTFSTFALAPGSNTTIYADKSGLVTMAKPGQVQAWITGDGEQYFQFVPQASKTSGYVSRSKVIKAGAYQIPEGLCGVTELTGEVVLRWQLFTIVSVVKTFDEVTVTAKHIFYELMQNVTNAKDEQESGITGARLVNEIVTNLASPDPRFAVYSNLDNIVTKPDYQGMNPVKALLDPDAGAIPISDGILLRDNFDIYAVKRSDLNDNTVPKPRYQIEYGKNLTGVTIDRSIYNTYTRIIPFCSAKNGDKLYLSDKLQERWIDSENHGDDYMFPRVEELDTGLTIGKDGVTSDNYKAKMRQVVADEFAAMHDEPELKLTINFIELGATEEYKGYKGLKPCYLYDHVALIDPFHEADTEIDAIVTAIVYDVINERMIEITTETENIHAAGERIIPTWYLPKSVTDAVDDDGKIDGSRIQTGTLSKDAVDEQFGERLDLTKNELNKLIDGTESVEITKDGISSDGEINLSGKGNISLNTQGGDVTINGYRVITGRDLVVSTVQPTSEYERKGTVWIQPTGVSNGFVQTRNGTTVSGNRYCTFGAVSGFPNTVPSAGTTYTAQILNLNAVSGVQNVGEQLSEGDHAATVTLTLYPTQEDAEAGRNACGNTNINIRIKAGATVNGSQKLVGSIMGDDKTASVIFQKSAATDYISREAGASGPCLVTHYACTDCDWTSDFDACAILQACYLQTVYGTTGEGWVSCNAYWYAGAPQITRTKTVYKRSAGMPAAPVAARVEISGNVWTNLDGWSTSIPDGYIQLWGATATVTARSGETAVLQSSAWSIATEPEAEVSFCMAIRADSAPAIPSAVQVNFSDGTATAAGWTSGAEADGIGKLYTVSLVQSGRGSITIDGSLFDGPVMAPESPYSLKMFKRSATRPSRPNVSYDFRNGVYTSLGGWLSEKPTYSADGPQLWAIEISEIYGGGVVAIPSSTWSVPVEEEEAPAEYVFRASAEELGYVYHTGRTGIHSTITSDSLVLNGPEMPNVGKAWIVDITVRPKYYVSSQGTNRVQEWAQLYSTNPIKSGAEVGQRKELTNGNTTISRGSQYERKQTYTLPAGTVIGTNGQIYLGIGYYFNSYGSETYTDRVMYLWNNGDGDAITVTIKDPDVM